MAKKKSKSVYEPLGQRHFVLVENENLVELKEKIKEKFGFKSGVDSVRLMKTLNGPEVTNDIELNCCKQLIHVVFDGSVLFLRSISLIDFYIIICCL